MLDELLDDDLDWPTEHPTGRRMEVLQEGLLCPICQDFFCNPQMLKCGHTYCSLCIQRHCDSTLNRTNAGFCPSCREKSDPFDLRKNVLIATLVDNYKAVRKDIFDLLQNSINHKSAPSSETATSSRSSGRVTSKQQSSGQQQRGHPISTRIAHFHLHGVPKEKVKKAIEDVTKHSHVKLRTDGDKDVLERRLRELVHLINAQVDAENALTLDETVAFINQQEKSKEMESRKTKIAQMQGQKGKVDKFAELTQKALASRKRKADGEDEVLTKDDIDHDLSLHEQVLEHEWLMHLSPEQFGPWRAVMSAKTKRPFFFNEITKMGQYKIPAELEALKPQPHDGRGSSQSQTRELEHTSVTIVATQNPTQINSQQMRFNSQSELQATMVEDLQSTLVDPTPIAIGSSIQYSEGDLFNLSQHMQPANVNVMPAPDASDDLFTLGIVPTNVQQGGDEGSVVEVQDESKADKGSNKPSHWTCALCTFINKKFSSKCSMCDSDNPDYFNISNKPRRSMRNTPFNFNDVPTQATNNMSSSKATQQSILGFGSPPPLGANTQTANKKSKR